MDSPLFGCAVAAGTARRPRRAAGRRACGRCFNLSNDTQEHKELETLMKQLEGASAESAEFMDTLANLREVLRDHVQDEETEQFPQLRAHVPAAKLIDLREKVELAKKVAPTRPHPAAPNSELFHKLAGPGVGLVDRLRDRLTGRTT